MKNKNFGELNCVAKYPDIIGTPILDIAEVSDSSAVPIGYFSRPPRVIHITP